MRDKRCESFDRNIYRAIGEWFGADEKRVVRAAQLMEEAELDHKLLDDLVKRYNLRLPST